MNTATENKNNKYFLYARRSTENEDKQAKSVGDQITVIRALAKRKKFKIVEVFSESKSAKAPGRPVFDLMIKKIKKGEANGILCWKLNRLARNPIDGGIISWGLQSNIITHICTSERDYYPEDNVLLMAVELGMANQFIKDLSSDTKRGMRQKAERGMPPCYAPTGYLNNLKTKNWEPDKKRAPFVVKAFELYDSGQYSLNKLITRLNNEGFTTRQKKPASRSGMSGILRNPAYYGYFRHNDELKKGVYKSLIDKTVWDRAQERLDGKAHRSGRSTRLFFKYRGFLFCGECGCAITAEKQKGHVYYRCTKSKGKDSCSQSYIREELLEQQLIDIFDDVTLTKDEISTIHGKLLELYNKDQDYQTRAVKNLKTQLTTLQEKKKKMFEKMLLEDFSSNDKETYNNLKKGIEEKIQDIESQITHLKDNTKYWLEQSSNLLKLSKQAKKMFLFADQEKKLQLLDFVSSNRVLKDKQVVFVYNKPFSLAKKMKEAQTKNRALDPACRHWLLNLSICELSL